jgi:hypothetical protein
MVVGCFGTGIFRMWEGRYLSRGMQILDSQKGNARHTRRQDAGRVALFAT